MKSNCYAHQVELETDLTDRPFSDNYFPLCTPQGVCVALEKNSVEPEVTVEQLRESLRVLQCGGYILRIEKCRSGRDCLGWERTSALEMTQRAAPLPVLS